MLLADVLALLVNSVFDEIGVVQYFLDFWTGIITVLFYGFQLYFDFSGYCDMARGIGKCLDSSCRSIFIRPLRRIR